MSELVGDFNQYQSTTSSYAEATTVRRRGRRPTIEVSDTSGYDPWDPFLFTSPHAVDDYKAGLFIDRDGTPRSLENLRWDLETEVMRKQSWTEEELQFRAALDCMARAGVIVETASYWNNSPHAVVYRVRETVKIRLLGRKFKVRKGNDVVFQCRMVRERRGLRGPFLSGRFSRATESLLCGEMSNALLGREKPPATAPSSFPVGQQAASECTESQYATFLDRLWPTNFGRAAPDCVREPEIVSADVQADDDVRVVYVLVDVSGSMYGFPLQAARRGLLTFIRTIPIDRQFRVALRAFNGNLSALQGSLTRNYDAGARRSLTYTANLLQTRGSTALYRAVSRALDDLQSLIHDSRTPKWYLIVLSDGENNREVDCTYAGLSGPKALFRRAADLRGNGLLNYLPIAYGSRVTSLDHIGGPGFRAQMTEPRDIVATFANIRESIMVGMPTPATPSAGQAGSSPGRASAVGTGGISGRRE